MTTVSVLGLGQVGSVILRDLEDTFKEYNLQIRGYDKDLSYIKSNFKPTSDLYEVDLSLDNIKKIASQSDIVVSAVPGSMGQNVVTACFDMKCPVIDISFMPFSLNENHFRQRTVDGEIRSPVILDVGWCPGLSNIILAHEVLNAGEENIKSFECYCGGLPIKAVADNTPYHHRTTWSIEGMMDEYSRPARYRLASVNKNAEDPTVHKVPYRKNGSSFEAFLSDGLRSLLRSYPTIPYMFEYTLRWPGHLDAVRSSFFFSGTSPTALEEIEKELRLQDDETEFSYMDIYIENYGGEKQYWHYFLQTEWIENEKYTSMAMSTGYVATYFVKLLLDEGVDKYIGIHPPEHFGDRLFEILQHITFRAPFTEIYSGYRNLSSVSGTTVPNYWY